MRSDRALLSEGPEPREIDDDGFDATDVVLSLPPPAAGEDSLQLPQIGDGENQGYASEQPDHGESSLLPENAPPRGPPAQGVFPMHQRRSRASRVRHYLYPCGALSPTLLLVTLLTLTVVHLVLLMQVWRIKVLAQAHAHRH
ncbi:hypothetical protein HPB50_013874 [Hyalomma asiaticum]|uniref:Uncharacterized protein n=1 Tax=Hyalomma asiaticum TaxID=266040 RepID=A0ACB7SKR7_HYAAI|nr:hypothetical protein HPB50_013874 [Hyalomma asiaticum]